MMKKKYTNMESRGLPGGPNEVFTYVTGVFSSEGYKSDSPDKNNPANLIASGSITMENVEIPVLGIDDLGNSKMMMPGNNYEFPGDMVLEIPMAQDGNGEKGKAKGNAFQDWWYNLEDVQSKYQMFNDIDNAWLSEWLSHPETIKRLQNKDVYGVMGKENEAIRKQALERLANTPVYNASALMGNYPKVSDFAYNQELQGWPEIDYYSKHFVNPLRDTQYTGTLGFYYPEFNYIGMRNLKPKNMGALAHEGVHATGPFQVLNEGAINLAFGPKRAYDEGLDIYGNVDEQGRPRLGSEYLDDDGLYPRIMDIRRNLGVKPGEIITEKMLDDGYDNNSAIALALEQLSQYYTPEQILNMFNTLASNNKELDLDKALFGNKERRRKKRGDLYLTREQLSQKYPGREHLHQDKLSPEDRVFGNNMAGLTDEINRLGSGYYDDYNKPDAKYELPIKFDDAGNATGVGQFEGGYGVRTRKGNERTNTVNFPLTYELAVDLHNQKEGPSGNLLSTGYDAEYMPLIFAPEVNVGVEKPSWIPKGGLDRATVNLMNSLSSEDQFKNLSREELYKTIKSGEAQKFIDKKAEEHYKRTGQSVNAGKTRDEISTAERVWDVITNVGDYTNAESRNQIMNSSMTANEINQAKANNVPGFEDALDDAVGVGDVIDMFNPLAIGDNMTRSIQDERYSDAAWDGIGLIPATKVTKVAKPIQTLLKPVGSTIQKGLNIVGDTKVGNVATKINKALKYDPVQKLSQASTNYVPAPIQKTAEFLTNSKAPGFNTWNFLTGKGMYGAALGDNESFGEDYKFSKSSPGRIGLNIANQAGVLPDNVKQNVQEELNTGIKASDVGKVLLNTVDPTIGKAVDLNPYVSKTIFKTLDTFQQEGGEPDIENIVNTREFNIPSLAKSLYGNKDQVIALQNALVDAGFDIGKSGADGIFGPNTTKAYTDYISSASEFDPRVSSYNSIISNIQSDDVSPLVSLAMEKAGRDFEDEEMTKLKSVFERVNMSSKAISEIMGGIDTEWLESATAGILGTESRLGTYASDGILKADPFDQRAKNTNPYGTMPAFELGDLKVAIQNLVGMDDAEKSLGIAKTKFENIDPEERAYLNITSPQDLLDPQKSIDLTILSLAKRYNRLKSYSSQFPELNMTEDDIRNLAILGHNEGDDAQSQTRFGRYMKNGDYNPKTIAEELHSMRSLFNPDSKTKDFSSSYYKHIPGGGKLFNWFGSESPTYIANVKNYMDQLYGNVKNKTMSGLRYDPEQKAYVKKEGGEKDADINEALKIYKDFFNNKYKGNPLEPMAKRFEELLDRKFWPKAKQNKMSPANYIMSNMP